MTVHTLKTWPDYWLAVESGVKTFEVRRNDRGFQPGDTLVLQEWDPEFELYTGRSLQRRVDYVLRDAERFGLQSGYVVLGMRPVDELPDREQWTVHDLQPDNVLLIGNVHAAGRNAEEIMERVRVLYPERRIIFFSDDIDVQSLRESELRGDREEGQPASDSPIQPGKWYREHTAKQLLAEHARRGITIPTGVDDDVEWLADSLNADDAKAGA